MFRAIGQFLTTTQFYLYGRNHFTLTGWEKAVSIKILSSVLPIAIFFMNVALLDLRKLCYISF